MVGATVEKKAKFVKHHTEIPTPINDIKLETSVGSEGSSSGSVTLL
jgi:hypothetical protein